MLVGDMAKIISEISELAEITNAEQQSLNLTLHVVRDSHANSGHQRKPLSIVVDEAKMNNIGWRQ